MATTKKQNNSSLIETSKQMKDIEEKMKYADTEVTGISKAFDNIDKKFEDYGDENSYASKHIKELKTREFYENMFIYIGLGFYIACCVYILLRRFPLHKIIAYTYYILEYLYNQIIELVNQLMNDNLSASEENSTNSTISAVIENLANLTERGAGDL